MAGKQADIKVGVLTNYDDKGLKQAETGLSGFKKAVDDADGVGGKFNAGWKNVKDQVSANSGILAAAAGGALLAFAGKAVGAFTDTAKAALDLSTATGLSTEQASRWIAVGDDFEVSAEALQTGLGKIAKTMDDAKWKQYGIETRDAGGAARDTNDILLDSLDMLSSVTNETERARIGQQLFGKGYQSLTPILGHTRAEYEKMLGTVEDGQVITEQEAEKAEKFRLAQDNLSDAVHDVTIQIGEQVAQMVPLINVLVKFIGLTTKAFGSGGIAGHGMDATLDSLDDMRGAIEAAGLSFGKMQEQVLSGQKSLEDVQKAIDDTGYAAGNAQTSTEGYSYAVQDLANMTKEAEQAQRSSTDAVDGYSYAAKDAKDTTDRLAEAAEQAKRKSDAFADSLRDQREKLDDLRSSARSAVDDEFAYRDSVDEAKTKVDEMTDTLKHHKATSDESTDAIRAARDAALEASANYATLNGAAIDSAGGIQRQIDSLSKQRDALAPGSPLRLALQEYIDALNLIPSKIETDIRLHVSSNATNPGAPGYLPPGSRGAEGGIIRSRSGGQLILAGEAGSDEALIPLDGKHGLGGGNTINLTVNAGLGTDGYAVAKAMVNALGEYDRRNGTNIVTPAGR